MNPLVILLIIIGVAAVIGALSFFIYRRLHPKLLDEKKTEEEFVQEELDRVLVPVEDEKTAQQINDYKDKEDE